MVPVAEFKELGVEKFSFLTIERYFENNLYYLTSMLCNLKEDRQLLVAKISKGLSG